jgi:hydroxysqualene dehydroxylase
VEDLGHHWLNALSDALEKNKKRIAVIGGGYSGMAAGVRITERGSVAIVFEAAPVLGGRARRIEYKGRTLDNGQHILSGAYTELLRLMDVVGLSSRVYQRAPLRLSMPPFRMQAPLLPAPLHVAWALLRAKGIGWRDRFAAIRAMQSLKKNNYVISPDCTVAEWLARHEQTTAIIDYLWQPLTVSALNTPIATASAQVLANVLRDALGANREASDLLLPVVDLSALFPEPAGKFVEAHGGRVHVGTKVEAFSLTDEHASIVFNGSEELFDGIVLAVAPHQRAPFEQHLKLAYLRALSGNNSSNGTPNGEFQNASESTNEPPVEPIVTVYFGFETAASLPEAMFGQARGVAQWFFDRRALSQSQSSNELVVAAVISASGPHEAWDQETLMQRVLAELKVHAPHLPSPARPPLMPHDLRLMRRARRGWYSRETTCRIRATTTALATIPPRSKAQSATASLPRIAY